MPSCRGRTFTAPVPNCALGKKLKVKRSGSLFSDAVLTWQSCNFSTKASVCLCARGPACVCDKRQTNDQASETHHTFIEGKLCRWHTLTRGSCFKHAVLYSSSGRLSMWQTDSWTRRGEAGAPGEKEPLHQPVVPLCQGLPLSVKFFHIAIVPELICLSPSLREKTPWDCLLRRSWPCGAWFFFLSAANWASRGNFISVSLVLGCIPPRLPAGARTITVSSAQEGNSSPTRERCDY